MLYLIFQTPVIMQIDIQGKINEKKLAFSHTLLPLYEAIVNSIHAIQENSATKPGIIDITINRSSQQELEFQEQPNKLKPISHFYIKDNGIGFTDVNYESFNFAHSTYKLSKGGKGIGRFIWLRAFQKAEIESTYYENNSLKYRRLNFEPTKNGIEKYHTEDLNGNKKERYTKVRLCNLKPEFQKWCNSDIEDLAFRIIEHCFVYFLLEDCPLIKISDGDNKLESVN